jgi:hypothetical protein
MKRQDWLVIFLRATIASVICTGDRRKAAHERIGVLESHSKTDCNAPWSRLKMGTERRRKRGVATGRRAMQWFSEATDTPISTAAYAAKVLQQFGGFPRGGQGGGANERHVTARELINLALAVFCNPIADAKAIITELRAMVPARRGMPLMCEVDERGFAPVTVPEDSIPILPGASLGEGLDAYVASVAEGKIEARPVLMLKFVGSLFGPPDWVEIIDDPFGQASSCMYISPKYISRKYSSSFVTGAQITREIVIGSGLLDTLIAICRDSISTLSSGNALAGAKPERKNAGFLAGKPASKPSRRKQPEASTSELTRSGRPPSTDPGVIRRCEK